MTKTTTILSASALFILAQVGLAAAATCAAPGHPGGEWPMYGHDHHNTRSQDAETVISAANAGQLKAAWSFTPADVEGKGRMESTPVVAEGCVHFGTSEGFVYALNADTGELVWSKQLASATEGQCCGGTIFAATVHDGVVYYGVARAQREFDAHSGRIGTFIAALDSQTGETKWLSDALALEDGAYTNSSVVYYEGMIWLGISGPEVIDPNSPNERIGGFVLLNAEGEDKGKVIKRTRTVPEAEFLERGDAGGSIWSTIAIDDEGFGYAATGQPNPWEGSLQSDYTNAIVKIDMRQSVDGAANPDLGEIIGTFWGDPDGGRDVDFAGSPTLYRNANGEQMVAGMQKSGNLHAGRTSAATGEPLVALTGGVVGKGMEHVWRFPVSAVGAPLFNFCSVANDGTDIYAAGAIPGQMWSVNGTTGVANWVAPVSNRWGETPVAHANGVIYYTGDGDFYVIDASNGSKLLERDMDDDVGGDCGNVGGGVAVARNTVYAMCGDRNSSAFGPTKNATPGWVVAYRLP